MLVPRTQVGHVMYLLRSPEFHRVRQREPADRPIKSHSACMHQPIMHTRIYPQQPWHHRIADPRPVNRNCRPFASFTMKAVTETTARTLRAVDAHQNVSFENLLRYSLQLASRSDIQINTDQIVYSYYVTSIICLSASQVPSATPWDGPVLVGLAMTVLRTI